MAMGTDKAAHTDGEVHRDARRVESPVVSRRSRYGRRTSNRGAQSQGLNEIDSNLLEFFSENLNCAPKILNTKVVQNLSSPTFDSGKTSFED